MKLMASIARNLGQNGRRACTSYEFQTNYLSAALIIGRFSFVYSFSDYTISLVSSSTYSARREEKRKNVEGNLQAGYEPHLYLTQRC